jgi:hypothetical protein
MRIVSNAILRLVGSWVNALIPVGVILPWHKSFPNTPALLANWVECNGQTLSDSESVYDGQVIPNLNGAAAGADLSNGDNLGKTGEVFLYGDETSGVTQFDNFQGHYHQAYVYFGGSGSYTIPFTGTDGVLVGTSKILVKEAITDGVNGTPRTGAVTRPRGMSVVYIIKIK